MKRATIITLLGLWITIASSEIIVPCPDGEYCFKIGFTYPKTGSLSPEGAYMVNGYILWAEKMNNNASYPFKFELIAYDDESKATNVVSLYQQLVNTDGVDFLFGCYGTSLGIKANIAANITEKFILHSNAAGEEVFNSGFPNVFGVLTPTRHYAEVGLRLFKQRGVKSISIAVSNVGFASSVAQGAVDFITNNGISLKGPLHYFNSTDSDAKMTNMLQTLKGYNADAFFSLGLLQDGEQVVRLCNEIEFKPKAFWMTSAPSDPQFIIDVGSLSEYLVGPAQWHPDLTYQGDIFVDGPTYVAQYKARFDNTEPSFISASATAAGLALYKALLIAGNTTDQNAVVSALQSLNITTFYGPIRFTENGENLAKGMVTTQVINGQIKIVAPEQVKTTEFVYPIPGSVPTPPPSSTAVRIEGRHSILLFMVIGLIVMATLF